MLAARRSTTRSFGLCLRCAYSAAASIPASPALLQQVRNDLKVAMKAKDTSRLDVLRGLISEVTNASKSSKPVNTDSQILAMIRKRVKTSEAAADEFRTAKREDLRAREIAQIAVLEEYVKDSNSMGEAEITTAIQDVIGRMRIEDNEVNRGSVMKTLVGPGGSLADQTVDKSEVSRLVGGMI